MEPSEKNRLVQQLKEATQQVRYWKQIAKKTGKLRLRESENLSYMIQTLKQTKTQLLDEIAERKSVEGALRESGEHLRAILEATPDPMVMYDLNGCPQFINPAFTEVFGWTIDELRGQRIPYVPKSQKDMTTEKIRAVYRSKKTSRFESKRLSKEGSIVDVIVSAAIIKGGNGEPVGMVVNLTDISKRKLLETKYKQAQKMKSLGTLAGGIAHDFNNILMGIQGMATAVMFGLKSTHPNYNHLKAIEECVQSAADLTKQLLSFARGGKYEIKPIDLNELVKNSLEMFGRTNKEVRIHNNLQESIHTVEADRRQIEQVLLNIYVNARQAMPDGGSLYIETKNVALDNIYCKPHQIEPGSYVKISIRDTGIGMDETTLSQIFDPFFTTKEKARGTGLGLASAYGVIKSHDGIINVYSEKGYGATFNVYLPSTEREMLPETNVKGKVFRGSETILLVDDENKVVDATQSMLEILGYHVITAKSGKKALDEVNSGGRKLDLIILDMIMPGMDGGKTFDRIREVQPGIPVILSSGYSIKGRATEIMEKGCNGFLQKPFNISELSKKVRKILDETNDSVQSLLSYS